MKAALQDEPGEDIAQALEDGWLPIREVARQTGVNAVTLRAWERRYGLIVPQRTPKGHRLFSAEHVQRIHTILTWLNRGVPVSQVKSLIDSAQPMADAAENEWHTLRQDLVQAVSALAERRVDDAFNQAMALYPPRTLCEQLLLPLLNDLEQRWQGQFGAQFLRDFFQQAGVRAPQHAARAGELCCNRQGAIQRQALAQCLPTRPLVLVGVGGMGHQPPSHFRSADFGSLLTLLCQ